MSGALRCYRRSTPHASRRWDFEARTFKQWDRASLGAVRIAIDRRRRELAG